MFWVVAIALTLGVAGMVLGPLVFGAGPERGPTDVAIYKAQLQEIDRDLARGVLEPEEAEAARTEIARRLLAADKAQTSAGQSGLSPVMALISAAVIVVLAGVTYLQIGAPGEPDQPLAARLANAEELRKNRPDQATLEAAAPPVETPDLPGSYLDSVAQLREIVPTRPDDLQGWRLLSQHEAELRNYSAAATAQARVLTLLGPEAPIAEQERLLDLMVAAANGFISPEAEAVLLKIREQDPDNIAARYYAGALFYQTDRADVAFNAWRPLVELEADTFHIALARAQIEAAAQRAGIKYELPEVRGPGLDEIAAAEEMDPEARAAMIGSMVAGLADRLASQGGPASDWARLIRAFGVLGDRDAAATVWAEAQAVFADDPGAMAQLQEAASAAGVAE